MLITNKNRRRQINSFIDKDHAVMSEFYEITDMDISTVQILKEMQRLIGIDEDFYDPYLIVADILLSKGRDEEADAMLQEAYERAAMTIADSKGRWPKEMLWGFLENRHLMRALEYYSLSCWETGKIDEALDIFRRLLRVNPNDNQGMRYNILAIRMGLDFEEWEKPFESKHNGEVVGLDAFKMSDWFRKNVENFPDEFQWLIEIYEKKEA